MTLIQYWLLVHPSPAFILVRESIIIHNHIVIMNLSISMSMFELEFKIEVKILIIIHT